MATSSDSAPPSSVAMRRIWFGCCEWTTRCAQNKAARGGLVRAALAEEETRIVSRMRATPIARATLQATSGMLVYSCSAIDAPCLVSRHLSDDEPHIEKAVPSARTLEIF